MADFEELRGRHAGRVAVVVGGAPSRLTEIGCCPENAIWLSANEHGCKARRCDYIICLDQIEARLRPYGVPIIGTRRWTDFLVSDRNLPNSAAVAAWAAHVMGCVPVIIIGVECYQGGTYADNPKAPSSGRRLSLARHLDYWRRLKTVVPDGDFRTAGGPLLALFPRWPG